MPRQKSAISWSPSRRGHEPTATTRLCADLKTPVTTEEIIRMVKADSGVEFKPNEVIIRPTAKASALNGGAFVDLLPAGLDPNNALNYKISMVFDASGKLVNYERDPSFLRSFHRFA